MDTISLDASVAITGISRSTLWRRVTDGTIGRGDKDERSRAMLALGDVLGLVDLKLSAEDIALLLQADQGKAGAQAELGALFALAALREAQAAKPVTARGGGSAVPALYFLTRAADQGEADAMHWLGLLHAAGLGDAAERDAQALMWVARAAAHGHAIAARQVAALLPAGGGNQAAQQ